ncbi:MAG: glucose-6-phosphate isomerase [Chloroflexi bacterium]|nr:glucose-6-phosphate isomerase [Chloroflexota bacterium]
MSQTLPPAGGAEPADLVARIWRKDASVWSDDPAVQRQIVDALGWLTIADERVGRIDELHSLATAVRAYGCEHAYLLGMGGSSLCPEVLRQTFGSRPTFPELRVIDTTSPDAIRELWRGSQRPYTLFVVSSKSGTTTESASFFEYFYRQMRLIMHDRAGQYFVVLTDPGTALEKLATERTVRKIFSTPPDVGGRYSALTYFGLVPAALIGMDLNRHLSDARGMMAACREGEAARNPGLALGLALGRFALQGRDKVTILPSPSIASFGLWAEQLLAESTGKQGRGLVPVAEEPLGDPEVYGGDRVFVAPLVAGDVDRELSWTLKTLEQAGHPVIRLELPDKQALGAEFFRWEFATAVAGALLGINPFDQPNVQESKDNTRAVLAELERSGALPTVTSADVEAIGSFLEQGNPGDYVAIMAYVPPTAASDAALADLRVSLRERTHLATTLGYGPRFLHSTGQLHKGGPNSGLFIQLVSDVDEDLAIPGQPYTFGTLIQAQALGDLRSLADHGRRVIRFNLGADVVAGVGRLRQAVERGRSR